MGPDGCRAYLVLTDSKRRIISVAWCVALLIPLAQESLRDDTHWSPYYKVETTSNPGMPGFMEIRANGVPHQLMAPAEWKIEQGERIYEMPYSRLPVDDLDNVLIIGAGSGSDVAIALANGAKSIDAVDIDPVIMELGAAHNIDRPYDDPRVTRHVDDGRAFLQNTDKKYDLVLFALPDSLTLVSGASQIRLESFLFTDEALQSVRRVLTDDGAFAMYNYYREDWLIDRLAGTAAKAFGHAPCVDTFADRQAVISIARHEGSQSCGEAWSRSASAEEVGTVTDDAPFLYFRGGGFPPLYAITLLGILVVTVLTVRVLGGPLREMRPYADLFFMGAAFLLLETKNIATFALLFGTTWFVNALETERRFRTPPLKVVFAAIAVALAAAWVIKPEWLLTLSFWPRLVAGTVLAFLPIYLANIAFAKRFRESSNSQSAFALNLIGTIVGGCLEYLALFSGYNNLLVATLLLYGLAFWLVPRGAARTA